MKQLTPLDLYELLGIALICAGLVFISPILLILPGLALVIVTNWKYIKNVAIRPSSKT
jgi:hypothetical protein